MRDFASAGKELCSWSLARFDALANEKRGTDKEDE